MTEVRLLVVVEVPQTDRVVCQAQGCKHPVYKRIHVVQKDGQLIVLGSECFKKHFGTVQSAPRYASGEGRQLTPEERGLLANNTARLIATFEAEHQEVLDEARLAAEKQAQMVLASKQTAQVAEGRTTNTLSANNPSQDAPTWRASLPSQQEIRTSVEELSRRTGKPIDVIMKVTDQISSWGKLQGVTPLELSARWADEIGVPEKELMQFFYEGRYVL